MSSLLEESHEVNHPSSNPSLVDPSPIDSYQIRETICGIETELLIQTFDDRVLVVVTQNGKAGCLTQASLPSQIPLPPPPKPKPTSINGHSSPLDLLEILPTPPNSINLTPLLGTPPDPTLYELYVNQISTLIFWALQISGVPRRNVVVGLSLKKSLSGNASDSMDEEGGGEVLNDEERQRYAGIMDLVSRWSGPAE